MLWAVRRYRPNYFSGFEDEVCRNVEYDKILECPWFANFKHNYDGGFEKFVMEDYGNGEQIISAYYKNGKHWVAGFACEEGSRMSVDWRYNPTKKKDESRDKL